MAVQEVDLNDIYEELIKLKDTLDKIEDIYDKIIEYDLEKNPSALDNNINKLKKAREELGTDHENKYLRKDYTNQIYKLEDELSTYNKQIASLWYTYVLHPRLLKKNLITKNGLLIGRKSNDTHLIIKNTCMTIKASQLLKFYYEKRQRLKEIYDIYKDQEYIEELLKDMDQDYINTIWEHEEEYFTKQIEEKDELIDDFIKQIDKLHEISTLLDKKLQTANNNLVLLEHENKKLLKQIRLLEKNQIKKPVETTNLLDIEYNPFDNLT